MNIPLLEKIKETILRDPTDFDMASYCGSACCIAGWAVRIQYPTRDFDRDLAERALQLNCKESDRLFHTDMWPSGFRARYFGFSYPVNPNQRAEIACERIDHFIGTEGRE